MKKYFIIETELDTQYAWFIISDNKLEYYHQISGYLRYQEYNIRSKASLRFMQHTHMNLAFQARRKEVTKEELTQWLLKKKLTL